MLQWPGTAGNLSEVLHLKEQELSSAWYRRTGRKVTSNRETITFALNAMLCKFCCKLKINKLPKHCKTFDLQSYIYVRLIKKSLVLGKKFWIIFPNFFKSVLSSYRIKLRKSWTHAFHDNDYVKKNWDIKQN